MEKTDIFKQLMDQFLADEISRQDLERLQVLMQDESLETALEAYLAESFSRLPLVETSTEWNNTFKNQLYKKIQAAAPPPLHIRRVRPLFSWRTAAAILLLLVSAGAYWWSQHPHRQPATTPMAVVADRTPSTAGVTLTLADGSTVSLDSLQDGVVAQQHGASAIMKNGRLVYTEDGNRDAQVVYNTVHTPKGTRFHLQLPDGTQVWLNAASTIRYPTRFTGPGRKVEITGETYFEVAAHEKMPFHVVVNDHMDIGVLGTHFNVNAYTNEENIHTTLLEGAIRVTAGKASATLHPGQQAIVQPSGPAADNISVQEVDADKAITWKEGYFNLDDARLEEVMRQLERWYDIDVVYEKQVPQARFWGRISTDVPLDKLVRNLAYLGVHARLEGRKLIITL